MKLVYWEEGSGKKHRSLLRDDDPDELAFEGLLQDPPDIEGLDWHQIKVNLHNQLFDRGLFNWDDVQRAQNGITGAVTSALKREVVALYRRSHKAG